MRPIRAHCGTRQRSGMRRWLRRGERKDAEVIGAPCRVRSEDL